MVGILNLILGDASRKRRLLAWLGQFPRLETLLRRVAASIRQPPSPLDGLSPQARHIYVELAAAIERHNKEHG